MDFHLNTRSQFVAKISAALAGLPANLDLPNEPCIIASISGGPDSTAMILALRLVSQQLGIELRACHINHKMRGAESDQDEQFCRQLCAQLLVPLEVYEETDPRAAGSESRLRATRYDFLYSCAQSLGSKVILLAHTHNDQVETMLFRLFRGTSSSGLTGMKTAHLIKNGIWLVRPMLNCSREEVLAFLSLNQISARTDLSNESNIYTRNFLRNKVLPLCLSRFPSMFTQLERLRNLTNLEDEFLNGCTAQVIEELGGLNAGVWKIRQLKLAHPALQRRALSKALEDRGIEVSFERVQTVLNMMADATVNQRLTLDEKWDLIVVHEEMRWLDKAASMAKPLLQEVPIKLPGNTIIASLGKVIAVAEWQGDQPVEFPHRTDPEAIVDLSAAELPIVLRGRRETDKIRPLGMTQLVSLKKYMHNNKSEHQEAYKGAVLADQEEVLWVPGIGMSEKIKVNKVPTHRISALNVASDYTTV